MFEKLQYGETRPEVTAAPAQLVDALVLPGKSLVTLRDVLLGSPQPSQQYRRRLARASARRGRASGSADVTHLDELRPACALRA
jgi:hypothetical protein